MHLKQLMLEAELLVFRRAYSAGQLDCQHTRYVPSLTPYSIPVPSIRWAQRTATRRQARTGTSWGVTRWKAT